MLYERDDYFFPPLDKALARTTLAELDDMEFDLVYKEWLAWYQRSSNIYHRDELTKHLEAMGKMFLQWKGLPEWFTLGGSGKEEEFGRFCDSKGYTRHQEEYQEWYDKYASLALEEGPKLLGDATGVIAKFNAKWAAAKAGKKPYSHVLIPAWFNSLIQNGLDKQAELRKMSYERYLLTPHWYYVRALTVLIFQARCVNQNCHVYGSPFWGDGAAYRQVHHISYENRGNERFWDVCMLCDKCHEAVHGEKQLVIDENDIARYLNTIWLG